MRVMLTPKRAGGVRERGTGRWIDLEGWRDKKTRCRDWREAERRVFEGMGLVYRESVIFSELFLPQSCSIVSRKTCRRRETLRRLVSRLIFHSNRDMLTRKLSRPWNRCTG